MIGLIVAGMVGVLGLAISSHHNHTDPQPGWHYVEVEGNRGPVKGAVYVPRGLDSATPIPALVFLHGYGECGTDGSTHLTVGLPLAVMLEPDRWPFVIVAPQKPVGNAEWEDYEDAVFAMLDLAIAEFNADADRVAITGLSQGGHGTITIASRHPDRFVAAAPVCGYVERWNTAGSRKRVPTTADSDATQAAADGLATLPVWLFHGDRDEVVLPAESRVLHAELTERGADVQLSVFPHTNHNAWDRAYRESGVWDWLATHLAADDQAP